MLAALLLRSRSTRTYLHGLHGVDTHQGMSDIGVQPVEHRLTQTRRDSSRDHGDPRANGVSVAADLPHQLLELLDARRIRTEKRVLIRKRGIDRVELQG